MLLRLILCYAYRLSPVTLLRSEWTSDYLMTFTSPDGPSLMMELGV